MNRFRPSIGFVPITILSLLIGGASSAGWADPSSDCVQACADQWAADKAACRATLESQLAELDRQAAECISNNPNPLDAALCVRQVNVRRFNARREYQRCTSLANTAAYTCYRNCTPSESTPIRKGRGKSSGMARLVS